MESVVSGIIVAPIATVWAQVRDFGNLAYFPLVERVELIDTASGQERTVHLRNGGVGQERLLARSDEEYRLDYLYVDDPALAFSDYRARISLAPAPSGDGTLLTWRSSYVVKPESSRAVRQFIEEDIYLACINGLRDFCEANISVSKPGGPLPLT